ncbi:MAG: alanine--glyoxylate aminotransferase family protein [Chloroflexia bacterium]|nr:alanine--glyoxylate aminotransferase family protein [Chloroflexia bacterium]
MIARTQTVIERDARLTQGRWLRIPGPTVVHPDAVLAQTRDMVPHRGPLMTHFMSDLFAKLRKAHGTQSHVLVWPGSGSAGWEAAIVNFLSPGDRVIATVCGSFGARWASIGEQFGLDVRRVEVEWGQAVTPELFAEALDRAGEVRAAFITHNETSTGVTNPLKELAQLARQAGALVLVDAVSAAGAMPLKTDEWELDWVLSGSQKAWMCPPGLMMAAVSDRALHETGQSGYRRFFWDVKEMAKAADASATLTTPPLSLLFALDAALDAIDTEGLEAVWERHDRLAGFVRRGLTDLGLPLMAAEGFESSSITAFSPPDGISASALRHRVAAASGIEIAVGQGDYADTINRIGHMGWVEEPELAATLEAIARELPA